MRTYRSHRPQLLIAAVLFAAIGVPLALAGPSSWTAGGSGSSVSPSGGTAAANEVTFWTSPTAISGNTGFLYPSPSIGRASLTQRLGIGIASPGTDLDINKSVPGGGVIGEVVNTGAGYAIWGASAGTGVNEVDIGIEAFASALGTASPGDIVWRSDGAGFLAAHFQTSKTGSPLIHEFDDGIVKREFLYMIDGTTGIIANRSSLDRDFNIRGTTNAALVYVDASANTVGIGDSTPAALFTVGSGDLFQVSTAGNITMNGDLTFLPTTDANGTIGSAAKRFKLISGATVVSGDLHLKDESRGAHWKLREEPDGISVVNMNTGKRYRMAMVEDGEESVSSESRWHLACRAIGVCQ